MFNAFTYTGRQLDSESGVYYYRNRYYHSQLGRLIRRDPIEGILPDANLYQYVASAPIGSADPTGLFNFVWIQGHHAYPLYLGGGYTGVPVWELTRTQHLTVHEYFRASGYGNSQAGKAAWRALSLTERQNFIKNSLRHVGVADDLIEQNFARSFVEVQPGVTTPRIGRGPYSRILSIGAFAAMGWATAGYDNFVGAAEKRGMTLGSQIGLCTFIRDYLGSQPPLEKLTGMNAFQQYSFELMLLDTTYHITIVRDPAKRSNCQAQAWTSTSYFSWTLFETVHTFEQILGEDYNCWIDCEAAFAGYKGSGK